MVTFQFYKVTGGKFIARLEEIRTAKIARDKHLQEVCQDAGATEVFIYDTGGVSHFAFANPPAQDTWRKVKYGWIPRRANATPGRVLHDRGRAINPAPEHSAALDVFKDKGLDRLIIGGPVPGRAFGSLMHRSRVFGKFEQGVFFIKVPVTDSEPYAPTDSEMIPCEEWETMKFMSEGVKTV